jgi:hypothetical protein
LTGINPSISLALPAFLESFLREIPSLNIHANPGIVAG